VISTIPVDIGDFAVSPDGKYIAAGDPKGAVTIWDFDSRQNTKTIQYDGGISCLAFSPNSQYLAIGTYNSYVHVWNLREKQETSRIKHLLGDVKLAVFSPDSRYIASAAWSTNEKSGAAIIWRVKDGSQVGRLTHERGNEQPKIFPDSDYYRFLDPVVRKI